MYLIENVDRAVPTSINGNQETFWLQTNFYLFLFFPPPPGTRPQTVAWASKIWPLDRSNGLVSWPLAWLLASKEQVSRSVNAIQRESAWCTLDSRRIAARPELTINWVPFTEGVRHSGLADGQGSNQLSLGQIARCSSSPELTFNFSTAWDVVVPTPVTVEASGRIIARTWHTQSHRSALGGTGRQARHSTWVALGDELGDGLGASLGEGLGAPLDEGLGAALGERLGAALGERLGAPLGDGLGAALGEGLGAALGEGLGAALGEGLGTALGEGMGAALGEGLGAALGEGIGTLMMTVSQKHFDGVPG